MCKEMCRKCANVQRNVPKMCYCAEKCAEDVLMCKEMCRRCANVQRNVQMCREMC